MDKTPQQKLKAWVPVFRDIVILLGGVSIAIHEAFFSLGQRPYLLVLAATMMGLPIVLRKDGSISNRDK